jgi:hypothetical protein
VVGKGGDYLRQREEVLPHGGDVLLGVGTEGGQLEGGGGLLRSPLCARAQVLHMQVHLDNRGTFREHSGNVRGVQGTCRKPSRKIRGTSREHLENVQGTFGERSGNVRGTFSRPLRACAQVCHVQVHLEGGPNARSQFERVAACGGVPSGVVVCRAVWRCGLRCSGVVWRAVVWCAVCRVV